MLCAASWAGSQSFSCRPMTGAVHVNKGGLPKNEMSLLPHRVESASSAREGSTEDVKCCSTYCNQ